MAADLSPLVHPKETRYLALSLVVSLLGYAGLAAAIVASAELRGVLLPYAIGIALFLFVGNGLLIGRLRGNGVRVSAHQFPELHATVVRHAARLAMPVPDVFVLQAGGTLNAFATRFLGRGFVVLYSDVLEIAAAGGEEAVSFVVGHELGHLKRRHLTWRALLLPARVVPFLGGAYSRACEYTCDRIGAHCAPAGGVDGLLALAAGKALYPQVDAAAFARQAVTEGGFWTRLAELLSTHPTLAKRVAALRAHAPVAPPLSAPAYRPAAGGVPVGA